MCVDTASEPTTSPPLPLLDVVALGTAESDSGALGPERLVNGIALYHTAIDPYKEEWTLYILPNTSSSGSYAAREQVRNGRARTCP